MARKPSHPPRPGETPLARDFFAGRYAKVVEATFGPSRPIAAADVAFVVGALTFLGRTEDAQVCFDGARRHGGALDPRTSAASRFFLGVAYARAGNFERAHRLLVAGALGRTRDPDPWVAAFVFQGLACHRYFTGRYRASAQHALRALRAAHVVRFGYVQMLANDLRGHALAQLGQYRAAESLLEQARRHSQRLGFGMNAYAIECSIANYGAEFIAGPEALERIQTLLRRPAHDSYSRRALLTESATLLALRGRCSEANAALDEADADARRADGRRAKIMTLLARLHVRRWSEGPAACSALLEPTRGLVAEDDVAFRVELLLFDALVARATGDDPRYARVAAELRGLARTHEHYRAKATLEQLDLTPAVARAFPEDELTPLLRAVATRDRRVLPRLLALGLLGPVPELLGLTPGRRIVFISGENVALLEDHGDLELKGSPPRWCVALLQLLARGVASKEQIVSALWGLRSYRPERHDPLVRTTIHRLRTFLAPHGDWIFVHDAGYGCRVALHYADAVESVELDAPLVDGEAPAVHRTVDRARAAGGLRAHAADDETPVTRVLEKLEQTRERVGVRELSRALGLSESTTLRALRELIARRLVVRTGWARATRYALRDARGASLTGP
ncbi:MAG: helix-turn-helix domain-containing protein [Myxococcales bacterium]|nr:helix-turn-helix domain-containing protein [Myxococcales bacterium]